MAKPSKETWAISTDLASNFPAFDGSSRLAAVATGPRRIQGLSLSEGKTLWESPLDGKPALDPLFANENLIYATADYQLVALNGDSGKENHRLKLDALNGYVLSGRGNHPKVLFPAMDGSRMVLATYGKGERSPTGWIYSIDLASWTIQWKFEFLGGPDLTPQIKGDKVLIGGGGRVLALNLADGKQVWECRVGSDEELKDGPLLGDRLAVVCGRNLLAIDTTRGTQLWSVPYQTFYQPQGDGERILYTEERGWIIHEQWVVALDIKTGKKVWDRELSGTRLPWIQDGVVLCNAKGTLMSLDLATGKQLWAHELKGAPALPLTVFGDALYVVNWEGDSSLMQALRLKDGSVAWDYTYPHKPSNGMVLLTPSGFVISGNDPTLLLLN
jgi:outer membrane protein assembly factor BamB